MPSIREIEEIRRRVTVEVALQRAVTRLPALQAGQQSSTPDSEGASGFFEDDDDGHLTYQHWFRAGDAVGSRRLRPW